MANPGDMAYDSGRGEVFVANGNNVSVINDTTNTVVATIPVGLDSGAVAYDSGKGEVFVTYHTNYESGPGNVSVINDTTNTVVTTLPVGINPDGLVYDSGKGEVFVVNAGPPIAIPIGSRINVSLAGVSVISDSNNTVVATILGYYGPSGATYDSGKGEVFFAGCFCGGPVGSGGYVTVISDANYSAMKGIFVVGVGYGVAAYDEGRGEVLVTHWYSDNLSVISDTKDTVVANITVGTSSHGLAYDSGKGEIFVANYELNSVSVINDSTDTIVTTVPAGLNPHALVYDSGKGEVFVSNGESVSVISDIASGSPGFLGLPGSQGYYVLGIGAAAGVVVVAVWSRALLPPPKPRVSPPPPGT
jgi:YVTN family beta-propeller protein